MTTENQANETLHLEVIDQNGKPKEIKPSEPKEQIQRRENDLETL